MFELIVLDLISVFEDIEFVAVRGQNVIPDVR